MTRFSEEVRAREDLRNQNLVKCYKANFNGFKEEIRAGGKESEF
jgi:hypothetical protein